MKEVKKNKRKKATGVWYLLGSLAVAIGISAVMPTVTRIASNYFFDKMYTPDLSDS